ncbi:TRAP transporter, 4TM/12TM fusion protein [Sulfitobacter noctilucicola]|uniref:TRAP transporter 4TM/12TM fusion protein n=1 Tax=Sulfitobacter noctilucicola TaxID=1342301 RepID=A0A7W6MAF2_9RHOB|nr:TRAP transporter fused permease subunit [Sulfitobacter noctilucicola]KIN64099.1 TRAP transporter, 4TM/12TM fusion protein [Sulfitobacter noctilucicola]MBB4175453.1 TRAP transporter 4TM/12TM fusion protein [Sulfitobacter noctilucicola]
MSDQSSQTARRISLSVPGILAALITLTSVFWSSGAPLWIGWRVYSEQVLICALAFAMAVAFLTRPSGPKWVSRGAAVASLCFGAWLSARFPTLSENVFYHPTEALIVSVIGFVLLLEAVRRTMGWSLIVILGCVSLYALFSSNFSGPLQSRSIAPDRLLTFLMLDSASLAGAALSIAVAVVVPFLILSQLLLATGGSAFFSDLSLALAGHRRGGAGKIAILGSAFFGSVSGSAVSNVASTGAITIPMMKDCGYQPKTAGAIEAAASTGGQLMPPIMGAAAFLLAENLQASYVDVMLAALIPSILYYFSLFAFADLEAGRRNISPVAKDRIPSKGSVLRKGWYVFAPFVVLLVGLFAFNLRPETSALVAIIVLLGLSLVLTYDGSKLNLRILLDVIVTSGRAAVEIILICAIAGMIIGLVARSGLSFGLGFFLVQLGQSSLLLLLVVTALVCIVMGMGLPTVGVYLLLASLAAPPLVELGLQPMAAHLFVLYFGMLSMLTPPVAIAAFVAANMAKAPPMATGIEAVRIAWPAYAIPFFFAASPALLFDGPLWLVAVTGVKAAVGVYATTGAITGFISRRLSSPERVIIALAGIAILCPWEVFDGAMWLNAVGIGAALAVVMLTPRRVATD